MGPRRVNDLHGSSVSRFLRPFTSRETVHVSVPSQSFGECMGLLPNEKRKFTDGFTVDDPLRKELWFGGGVGTVGPDRVVRDKKTIGRK